MSRCGPRLRRTSFSIRPSLHGSLCAHCRTELPMQSRRRFLGTLFGMAAIVPATVAMSAVAADAQPIFPRHPALLRLDLLLPVDFRPAGFPRHRRPGASPSRRRAAAMSGRRAIGAGAHGPVAMFGSGTWAAARPVGATFPRPGCAEAQPGSSCQGAGCAERLRGLRSSPAGREILGAASRVSAETVSDRSRSAAQRQQGRDAGHAVPSLLLRLVQGAIRFRGQIILPGTGLRIPLRDAN